MNTEAPLIRVPIKLWGIAGPTVQYNTVQYNSGQCDIGQYNIGQYNTLQYKTLQYNIPQYNTILTAPHWTVSETGETQSHSGLLCTF